MTSIDQAARRAAEQIDHRKWDKEMNMAETKQIIAAEFAPLQERLVEAKRLLVSAKRYTLCGRLENEIDKFLAAKEAERE